MRSTYRSSALFGPPSFNASVCCLDGRLSFLVSQHCSDNKLIALY